MTPSPANVIQILSDEIPAWASATILVRDEAGHLVGYGRLTRTGETAAEIRISSDPEGVHLLGGKAA